MTPYWTSADGRLVIYHGRAEDVLPTLLGDWSAVITDPPYQSLDIEVATGTTTRLVGPDAFGGKRLAAKGGRSWFSTLSNADLLGVIRAYRSRLTRAGALYVCADVKSGLLLFPPLEPANVLVWDKGHIGMGFNWRRTHEWIAFCPQPQHVTRDRSLGDILRVPGVVDKTHPTEKPFALFRPLIRNSTDRDDLVIDPFMGLGPVLLAARIENRRAIGIEIEERYAEIAAKRLEDPPLLAAVREQQADLFVEAT